MNGYELVNALAFLQPTNLFSYNQWPYFAVPSNMNAFLRLLASLSRAASLQPPCI